MKTSFHAQYHGDNTDTTIDQDTILGVFEEQIMIVTQHSSTLLLSKYQALKMADAIISFYRPIENGKSSTDH